ncbi:MAG: hypothetical protein ACLT98_00110 [Eggerthellaceae bacterium]
MGRMCPDNGMELQDGQTRARDHVERCLRPRHRHGKGGRGIYPAVTVESSTTSGARSTSGMKVAG